MDMERKRVFLAGILLILSGCGLSERLSTKGVRDDSIGVYLRIPKNWTSASEGEALVVTGPSGVKITITSSSLPAQSEVLGTDQHSAAIIRDFTKQRYKTDLADGWRLNGFYTRTVKAVKGDEMQAVWVTAIPRVVTVYEVRFSGKKGAMEGALPGIESALKKEFRFTKINSIIFETPLWTITSANYGGYMFWVLVLVCIVFLGRYFFIDGWRLVRAPADVFRDLARGEGFIYPVFWILLAAFLAGAIYGSLLPGEISKVEQRIAAQAESTRQAAKGMTTDPYLEELLVQDMRERAVQPLVTYLETVLFYVPVVVLVAWLAFGILLFVVLKIFRGRVALFATIKAVTILFALWSLAGSLIYAGQVRGDPIQQYIGYGLAAWGVFLILVMMRETGRVNFGIALVGLVICAGTVGYGLNYVKTSQFEPVQSQVRGALSPNRRIVDQFATPFSTAPAASPTPGATPQAPTPPASGSPPPMAPGRGY
jgi:hypothetical protein